MNIVIPAAGKGTRFSNSGYSLSKPLIEIDNEPMILKAVKSLDISGRYIFILQHEVQNIENFLKQLLPNSVIIYIDYYTSGAASSVLLAENYINNDEELFVANCDQIMEWDSQKALAELRNFDAGVITVNSTENKHSYVQIDNFGHATRFAEKQVISNNALTGLHYWKYGSDFVSSAKEFIEKSEPEYYIAPTYNVLIHRGKKVGIHKISESMIHFVGTPQDLKLYESRKTIRP